MTLSQWPLARAMRILSLRVSYIMVGARFEALCKPVLLAASDFSCNFFHILTSGFEQCVVWAQKCKSQARVTLIILGAVHEWLHFLGGGGKQKSYHSNTMDGGRGGKWVSTLSKAKGTSFTDGPQWYFDLKGLIYAHRPHKNIPFCVIFHHDFSSMLHMIFTELYTFNSPNF